MGKGGHNSPGAEMSCPNNVASILFSIQHTCLRKTSGSNTAGPNLLPARAPSNLGTPMVPRLFLPRGLHTPGLE